MIAYFARLFKKRTETLKGSALKTRYLHLRYAEHAGDLRLCFVAEVAQDDDLFLARLQRPEQILEQQPVDEGDLLRAVPDQLLPFSALILLDGLVEGDVRPPRLERKGDLFRGKACLAGYLQNGWFSAKGRSQPISCRLNGGCLFLYAS